LTRQSLASGRRTPHMATLPLDRPRPRHLVRAPLPSWPPGWNCADYATSRRLTAALRIRYQMLSSPAHSAYPWSPGRRTGRSGPCRPGRTRQHCRPRPVASRTQTMTRFRPRIAGSSFVTWTAPATALPIAWDEALRRLHEPDTVQHRRAPAPYNRATRRQAASRTPAGMRKRELSASTSLPRV